MDVLGFDFSNSEWAEVCVILVLMGFKVLTVALKGRQERHYVRSGWLKGDFEWTDPWRVSAKLLSTTSIVALGFLAAFSEFSGLWLFIGAWLLIDALEDCCQMAMRRNNVNSRRRPTPQEVSQTAHETGSSS